MTSGLPLTAIPFYMLIMAAGFLLSILTGACVGIFAENQQTNSEGGLEFNDGK